jgi:restriction system protein
MDGELFEWWVAEGLRRQGWHVELTPSSGDYGADLIATKDGQRTAVQVKRYTKQVGVSAVQQAFAGAVHWKCTATMVITSSAGYTPAARNLAGATGTTLITRRDIDRWRPRRLPATATPIEAESA